MREKQRSMPLLAVCLFGSTMRASLAKYGNSLISIHGNSRILRKIASYQKRVTGEKLINYVQSETSEISLATKPSFDAILPIGVAGIVRPSKEWFSNTLMQGSIPNTALNARSLGPEGSTELKNPAQVFVSGNSAMPAAQNQLLSRILFV